MRVWDLKGSNFSSHPQILYDHEEEIVQAATGGSLLATMDAEGNLLVRDVRSHQDVLHQTRLDKQYETGYLLYNCKAQGELFVFYNNEMELYDGDGRVIQRMEFDHNVMCAT